MANYTKWSLWEAYCQLTLTAFAVIEVLRELCLWVNIQTGYPKVPVGEALKAVLGCMDKLMAKENLQVSYGDKNKFFKQFLIIALKWIWKELKWTPDFQIGKGSIHK